ncbi:FliM/FliN family flagellar motor switch protein [Salipiger mucosus]|uniref:Flagellar motor switch protein n=1 Tax=Salipiger mucosus DSM 16094 TaxID=1123237 RepID=S9R165_9RHOB|nr:FliM/FliN family flagellar motor switch protein [Salipiger mucosus]EPX85622.1 Flagellar motor switch protein [Salipiger mucosus DSM 16094]
MGDAAIQDVLGQKATAARRALEARAMSPAKALRRALSRTADVLWDLALVTHGVSQEILDQDGVIDLLPHDSLLLLLDGPEGAIGLAAVDREVMTGLIEVQTILQVTQMPIEDRALTQTDAAMMTPMIDGTMERLARYLQEHPLCPQIEGYRFGAMIEDARAAGLLLDAAGYRAFRVSVDLALGRRRGELMFILPERPENGARGAEVDSPGEPGPHEARMKLLPVRMDAVLCRLTLSLREAEALRPGDLLPLPPEALQGVLLHAASGEAVAGGRLGQLNGMRAVRLTWPEGAGDGEAGQSGARPEEEPSGAGYLSAVPEATAEEAPFPFDNQEDVAEEAMAADLPDLPPMEFDTGDFGFDAEAGDDLGDFDFAAAPLDPEQE